MSSTDDILINGKRLVDLRVVDLKELLDERRLSKSGSKPILIARLKEALDLEQQQNKSSHNDNAVPNIEMKSCGSNIVAKYLEEQQRALLVAKKAAQEARAAQGGARNSSSGSNESSHMKNGQKLSESDTPVSEVSQPIVVPPVPEQQSSQDPMVDDDDKITVAETTETLSQPDATTCTTQNPTAAATFIPEDPVEPKPSEPEPVVEQQLEKDLKEVEPETEVEQQQAGSPETDSGADVGGGSVASEDQQPSQPAPEEATDSSSSPPPTQNDQSQSSDDDDDIAGAAESRRRSRVDRFSYEDDSHKPVSAAAASAHDETTTTTTAANVDVFQGEAAEKPQKKRRWGTTTMGKKTTVSITSDSLQEIVGHVSTKIEPEISTPAVVADEADRKETIKEDVAAPSAATTTTIIDEQVQLDYDDDEEEEPMPPPPKRIVLNREEDDDDEADSYDGGAPKIAPKPISEKSRRLTEPTFDEGYRRDRPASPTRRHASRILHIRCLTRPFTQKGLFHFLQGFGSFLEDEFWIDNIKSHCFVTYESKELAQAARDELDNLTWPLTNPNRIRVDFATEADLYRHSSRTTKENKPLARAVNVPNKNFDEGEKGRSIKELTSNDLTSVKRTVEVKSRGAADDLSGKFWPKAREWDRGKEITVQRERSPVAKRDRRRSPEILQARDPTKPVLMEQLFRKTKASPQIYWQPLTHEQIAERKNKASSSTVQKSVSSSSSNRKDDKVEMLKKLAHGGLADDVTNNHGGGAEKDFSYSSSSQRRRGSPLPDRHERYDSRRRYR